MEKAEELYCEALYSVRERQMKKRSREDIVIQIGRDICRDNKICTCSNRDGSCISIRTIAYRLAEQGYVPPKFDDERGNV